MATLTACAGAPSVLRQAQDDITRGETGQLLYVTDGTFGNVYAFSYPGAKLVAELTHLKTPEGVCHDKAGNVYIVIAGSATISEYPHGGSEPIKTLSDSSGTPLGCAVDPLSGDLAVVNETGQSGGSGSRT